MHLSQTGVQRIANERHRQLAIKGYTTAHDVEHDNGALAWAAAVYAAPERFYRVTVEDGVAQGGVSWREPWPHGWRRRGAWAGDRKTHGTAARIRELEKAGALIAAEIDRLIASEREGA